VRYPSFVSSPRPRPALVLAASLAGAFLVACANDPNRRSDPYAPRGGYYGDPYYYDPYYRNPEYIVVDPGAEKLDRHQDRERDALNEEQHDEKRDLKKAQEAERKALRQAGEWDKQDRKAQEQERKAQKQIFKQQDQELREHQREEWQERY
jgi:hypothetical protein